jgi:hypothetical protein
MATHSIRCCVAVVIASRLGWIRDRSVPRETVNPARHRDMLLQRFSHSSIHSLANNGEGIYVLFPRRNSYTPTELVARAGAVYDFPTSAKGLRVHVSISASFGRCGCWLDTLICWGEKVASSARSVLSFGVKSVFSVV